jgi:shikimate kinase
MPLLILIGPKHSGKTSVGLALKAKLNAAFVDVDALIEKRNGRSARALYRKSRDAFFQAEAEAIASIKLPADDGTLIVATGGGLVDNDAALEAIGDLTDKISDKTSFIPIYLEVTAETAWRRIEAAAKRGGGMPAFLDMDKPKSARAARAAHAAIHKRRCTAYRMFAIVTVNGEAAPEEVAAAIITGIDEYKRKKIGTKQSV